MTGLRRGGKKSAHDPQRAASYTDSRLGFQPTAFGAKKQAREKNGRVMHVYLAGSQNESTNIGCRAAAHAENLRSYGS